MKARRPPWYEQTTSTKNMHATVGNPLNVLSIVSSHEKPKTFIVVPEMSPARSATFGVCPCRPMKSGTNAMNAHGHTSMPAKPSQ